VIAGTKVHHFLRSASV